MIFLARPPSFFCLSKKFFLRNQATLNCFLNCLADLFFCQAAAGNIGDCARYRRDLKPAALGDFIGCELVGVQADIFSAT